MKKVRVYELARELDVESKVLVDFLVELGADIKNHMSTIEDDIAELVRDHFAADETGPVVDLEEPDEDLTGKTAKVRKAKARERHFDDSRGDARKLENDRKKRPKQGQRPGGRDRQENAAPQTKSLEIGESIVLKDLATKLGVSPAELIKKMMKNGQMVTVTQSIDRETAALLAADYGVEVERIKDLAETVFEEPADDDPDKLMPRPPVVTIMGHVDHGKTTLLDGIRQSKVVETEAGGITQHIGAYQVEYNGKKITFLDTPGHEAFTEMRSRGAKATDIAVLVVAADDGVMPQTVEAINHAKAAQVPIIVAINKMDRPNANPDRVKQELAEQGLVPEEWGGDTICVPVSALRLEGIDDLLEMILLVSEMEGFQANPDRLARGTVIEAKLDKGRGPVATVLVSSGTLRVGDSFVVGTVHGRVRAMLDHQGKNMKEAGPSQPVEVLGISEVPEAGDVFVAVENEQIAKQVAEMRQQQEREANLAPSSKVRLDDLFARIKEGEVKELNVLIKADVQGSAEALASSLEKLSTDEVKVKIIHKGVGAVTQSDVHLAAASNAIIIGFNVRPETNAKHAGEREGVDIRLYRIIYNVIDDIKAAMAGLLSPDYKEVVLGRAEVRQTFHVPNAGTIAGCYVIDGRIRRTAQARLLRDNVVIHEGEISSLKRFKDDVREVAQGYECGIGLERYNDIKEGDVIEAFVMEEVAREL